MNIVVAVIATTLGILLLILFSYGVYKQKQIRQNGHLSNGAGETRHDIGLHEHSDIVDIHEENCPSLANFPIRKINLYDITKECDQFEYLKDVPRCRCYSV